MALRPTTRALQKELQAVSAAGLGDPAPIRPKRSILDDRLMVKPGSRQNPCGLVTTVFGCNGFLGEQVVYQYAHFGSQVITPYRGDSKKIRELKVMGDLGQIVPMPYNFYDKESVRRAIRTSHVVVNCVGMSAPTHRWTLHDANVKCSYRLAEMCREAGVDKFVHVSALGAAPETGSPWHNSKWESEQAVKEVLPDATVVRVGPMFGEGDSWLERMAVSNNKGKVYAMLDDRQQVVQPVHVSDVAEAITNIGFLSGTQGQTYELGGPVAYQLRDLQNIVREKIYLPPIRDGDWHKYTEDFNMDPTWVLNQLVDMVQSPDCKDWKDLYIPYENLKTVADFGDLYLNVWRGGRGPPRHGDGDDMSHDPWNTKFEEGELSALDAGSRDTGSYGFESFTKNVWPFAMPWHVAGFDSATR